MKKWLFLIGGVVMGVIFTLVITIIANSEDNTTVDEVNNTTQVNNTSFFDEDETPDLENIRIVEVKKKDNKTIIIDEKNEEKGRISDLFIDELRKGIN